MSTPHQRPESTKPSEPAPDEPTFARLHVWQIQSIRDVMLVITVLTILWLGYAMSTITIPLLVALALAYPHIFPNVKCDKVGVGYRSFDRPAV